MSSVWRPTSCDYSRILASKSDALCDMSKWCIVSRLSSTSYYMQFLEGTSPGVLSTTLLHVCRYSNVCRVFKCKNENEWMTHVHWSILQCSSPSPIMPICTVPVGRRKKRTLQSSTKFNMWLKLTLIAAILSVQVKLDWLDKGLLTFLPPPKCIKFS